MHKDDLLRLLASGPFDGLEIDYERVDPQAWATLLDFAADLANQLAAHGKKLRFLLEPKTVPADSFDKGARVCAYGL